MCHTSICEHTRSSGDGDGKEQDVCDDRHVISALRNNDCHGGAVREDEECVDRQIVDGVSTSDQDCMDNDYERLSSSDEEDEEDRGVQECDRNSIDDISDE